MARRAESVKAGHGGESALRDVNRLRSYTDVGAGDGLVKVVRSGLLKAQTYPQCTANQPVGEGETLSKVGSFGLRLPKPCFGLGTLRRASSAAGNAQTGGVM